MQDRPELSNWGRWGAEDERGTANYLTPEIVCRAAGLVRTGRSYSLALPIHRGASDSKMRNPLWHLNTVNHWPPPAERGAADDMIVMHTQSTTHVDGLASFWYGNRIYNGFAADEQVDRFGAHRDAIFNLPALIGRGVLLDIAGFRGVEEMGAGEVIAPEEMEACARAQGVAFAPGDILLLRTGWIRSWIADGGEYERGQPGIGQAALGWLHERRIAAVGADTLAVEVRPFEDPDYPLPVHKLFIRDMGGYLLELLHLEELAADRVYEFLFVGAPLRLLHGVNSPWNPVAIA
jgi:kynurenine formamidase